MMFISQKGEREQYWHIGLPLPYLKEGRVIFEANGPEATIIINAMKKANEEIKESVDKGR